MSRLVKGSCLAALYQTGALATIRRLQRSRVVVLTYHGVLSGSDDSYSFLNANFVAASAFARQIQYVARHYRPVRLAELDSWLNRGCEPPERTMVVTFDDGFKNNYQVAFPILRRYGIPFTVFLTAGLIGRSNAQLWTERVKRSVYLCDQEVVTLDLEGRPTALQLRTASERERSARLVLQLLKTKNLAERDAGVETVERACGRREPLPHEVERYEFLSWDDVRVMTRGGVEFGSHSLTHPILSTLDEPTARAEITESKRVIEAQSDRECYAFAYPNGSLSDFGPREQGLLKTAGYRCAFTLTGGLNGRHTDRFAMNRVNISREFGPPVFEATVSGVLGAARSWRRLAANASQIVSGRLKSAG